MHESQLSREAAKHDPATAFKSPGEIVEHILMTRGEKLATLRRWRVDVLQQLSASDDGMRTQRKSEQLTAVLQEIEQALNALSERQ